MMKRSDKSVIVEVKRSGRTPAIKAGFAESAPVAPETMTSRELSMPNAARRAADLLFSPRTESVPAEPTHVAADEPTSDQVFGTVQLQAATAQAPAVAAVPPRRVLPSLVEAVEDPVARLIEAEPTRRRGRPPGRRQDEPDASTDASLASADAQRAPTSDGIVKRGRGRPPRNPGAVLVSKGARTKTLDSDIASQALDALQRLGARGPQAPAASKPDLFELRQQSATPLVSVAKRRGRPPKLVRDIHPQPQGERIWASSKVFAADDDVANGARLPADAVAAPRELSLPVRRLVHAAIGIAQADGNRAEGHEGGRAQDRLSFRARVSQFKPGERWKRRLRGFAR